MPIMQPLTELRQLLDAELPRGLPPVGAAVLRHVDNATRRWPTTDHGRGVTVSRLGRESGYSRRHTGRLLQQLDARGIVQVRYRPGRTSVYTYIGVRPGARAPTPSSGRSRVPAAGATAIREPSAPRPSPTDALAMAMADALHLGDFGRGQHQQIRRLLAERGSDLLAEARVIGNAIGTCRDPIWRSIRGELGGRDRSRSPRYILRATAWAARLEAARRHAQGLCTCAPAASAHGDRPNDVPEPSTWRPEPGWWPEAVAQVEHPDLADAWRGLCAALGPATALVLLADIDPPTMVDGRVRIASSHPRLFGELMVGSYGAALAAHLGREIEFYRPTTG